MIAVHRHFERRGRIHIEIDRLLGAGREGRFSIDDALCAGMLLSRLKERLGGTLEVEDAGRAALALAEAFGVDDALLADAAAGRARRILAPQACGRTA